MKFTKLHGLGNDYVCVNCFEEEICEPEKLAADICRRRFGIGADGLILIKPSLRADFYMEMYNSDGSRGAMCGNGIRCLAKFVYDRGMTKGKRNIVVETDSGFRRLYLHLDGGKVSEVTVDMGVPELCTGHGNISLLNYRRIVKRNMAYRNYRGCSGDAPFDLRERPYNKQQDIIQLEKKIVLGDIDLNVINVSVGNPHAVILCDDFEDIDVRRLGSLIEKHKDYPERTNVEFACVKDTGCIDVKVWERGAGETLACGTGACAACTAAIAAGKTGNAVRVSLPGGELSVSFNGANGHMILRGPVAEIYRGEW